MTALCKLESIVGRFIYRLLRSPLLIILLLMLHLLLLLLLLLLLRYAGDSTAEIRNSLRGRGGGDEILGG